MFLTKSATCIRGTKEDTLELMFHTVVIPETDAWVAKVKNLQQIGTQNTLEELEKMHMRL